MNKYRITIEHDPNTGSPLEYEPWILWSFNSRHINYKHPEELGADSKEMRAKIENGSAFRLQYYEHGLCRWDLAGSGPQCQWDSVQFAGILLHKEPIEKVWQSFSHKQMEQRARSFLEVYTNWCNGCCYWYRIEKVTSCEHCAHGILEDVDSCGGYIGEKDVKEAIKEALAYEHKENEVKAENVEIVGVLSPYITAEDVC